MQVQNKVGPEEYGLYFLIYDFAFLFLAINDPGLQAYASKTLAGHRTEIPRLFSEISGLKLVLAVLFIGISLGTAWSLGYSPRQLYLLGIISAGMFLSSSFVLMRTVLTGHGRYRLDSLISSLDRLLIILVIGSVFIFGKYAQSFQIEEFALAQLGSYLAACIILAGILLYYNSLKWPTFNLRKMLQMVKATLPFAGIIFLTSICNRIDVVMLNELLDQKTALFQSGVYAAGYRFLDAANMLGFLFGSLLLPMFSRLMSLDSDVKPLFRTGFGLLLFMSVTIGLAAIFYADDIFRLAYTPAYRDHTSIMKPLMLSLIPITLSNAFGPLILAKGSLKWLNIALGAAIVLNVTLNLWAIPHYQAQGSAYTTLITEVFLLIAMGFIAHRVVGVRLGRTLVLHSLLYIGLCLLLIFILSMVQFFWVLEAILFVLLSGALALKLNLLDIQSFQELRQEKSA